MVLDLYRNTLIWYTSSPSARPSRFTSLPGSRPFDDLSPRVTAAYDGRNCTGSFQEHFDCPTIKHCVGVEVRQKNLCPYRKNADVYALPRCSSGSRLFATLSPRCDPLILTRSSASSYRTSIGQSRGFRHHPRFCQSPIANATQRCRWRATLTRSKAPLTKWYFTPGQS